MDLKEISDSLIHTAPRSVSLVHHNFRNDVFGVILYLLRKNKCYFYGVKVIINFSNRSGKGIRFT